MSLIKCLRIAKGQSAIEYILVTAVTICALLLSTNLLAGFKDASKGNIFTNHFNAVKNRITGE